MSENTYEERIRVSGVMPVGFNNHREEFIEKGYIAEKYLDEFETLLDKVGTVKN